MKASILINNYNYAPYLKECIDSAILQDYPNIEVIVYDDGSTDQSAETIRSYGSGIVSILAENFGKFPSFNQANAIYQAFLRSSGHVIFLLDSDDIFHQEKVSQVMHEFGRHPDVIMIQHKFREVNEIGVPTGRIRKEILMPEDYLSVIRFTGRLEYLFMQTSALAFRRSYLDQILPLPVDDGFEKVWPDVRLTRQAVFYGRIKTIDKCLADYRIHGRNDSDKVQNQVYFKNFLVQQYQYFNQLAQAKGKACIPFRTGKLHNLISKIKILVSMGFSQNSTRTKYYFITRLIMK